MNIIAPSMLACDFGNLKSWMICWLLGLIIFDWFIPGKMAKSGNTIELVVIRLAASYSILA